MSDTESANAARFVLKAFGSGIALALMATGFTEMINWYFKLGLYPDVATQILALTFTWITPITVYALYNQVNVLLPTWLTSGHPVSFDGVKPNICADSTIDT
jgi:hypothetical protein